MPSLFEPAARFSRGIHKVLEVDLERLTAVKRALDIAYSVGNAAPVVSLISEHAGINLEVRSFWEADDGYPACRHLVHYIPKIVKAEGAVRFGLDLLGEIYPVDLVQGSELIDRSQPMSPDWLAATPDVPFRYASAEELLGSLDFNAGLDEQAVSSVTEAFDMGELGDDISGVGDFQVDALDDWAGRLRDGLADLQFQLSDIAEREGVVLSWYQPS